MCLSYFIDKFIGLQFALGLEVDVFGASVGSMVSGQTDWSSFSKELYDSNDSRLRV
jgi:hypothetical protein